MGHDERVEFIKETMKEFRAAGTEALKQRYPELASPDDKAAAPSLPPGFQLQRR
ncbi:MAG: hypothetical protein H0T82_03600 [Sphingomonas sp.]|nr:hypothetical protein [Sphingomonas sp.]